ncbi:MAG TPA: hypothetical protein VFX54_14490, partial [Candidatus Binatia bacterium]|nr:hypothetical protein [Candidatus Binatia bacterium]
HFAIDFVIGWASTNFRHLKPPYSAGVYLSYKRAQHQAAEIVEVKYPPSCLVCDLCALDGESFPFYRRRVDIRPAHRVSRNETRETL